MAQDFSYLHEERLRALITAKGTARTEMPGGWHAAARYGVLALVCAPMAQRSVEKSEILLPLGDEYVIINFQGMTFHVRCLTHMTADDLRRMERREAVYADLAQMPPLVLRTRRAGDYIQLPIGRRKIKDVFIDDKIPREDRDNIPLVAAAGTHEIFWMVGGRRSVRAPVTASSSDILSIAFVKETIAR